MGFWDFFWKKDKPAEAEKIKLSELQSWLQTKKTEIEEQEKNFLKLIQKRISQLIQELEEEISAVEKVDIEEKKAEEKIKLIVKENLKNYIYYLNELIDKLSEINEKPGKEIIEKINSVFSNFKKRSSISFEKATFIIGKELGNIKESIKLFFKELENILKKNQDLIDRSKIISSVQEKIEKFSKVNRTKSEVENITKEYNGKISELEGKIKGLKDKIIEIMKSEEFIEQEKKKQELKNKKQELEKEIGNLRGMIDFKSLTGFFHSFEKEMGIIKSHKENFKEAFQKTDGEEILSLFKEAKLQDEGIIEKIEEITKIKKEIDSVVIEEIGIGAIETAIKKIRLEIDVFGYNKIIEEKRRRKLEENLKEIIRLIKEELIKINVDVC